MPAVRTGSTPSTPGRAPGGGAGGSAYDISGLGASILSASDLNASVLSAAVFGVSNRDVSALGVSALVMTGTGAGAAACCTGVAAGSVPTVNGPSEAVCIFTVTVFTTTGWIGSVEPVATRGGAGAAGSAAGGSDDGVKRTGTLAAL